MGALRALSWMLYDPPFNCFTSKERIVSVCTFDNSFIAASFVTHAKNAFVNLKAYIKFAIDCKSRLALTRKKIPFIPVSTHLNTGAVVFWWERVQRIISSDGPFRHTVSTISAKSLLVSDARLVYSRVFALLLLDFSRLRMQVSVTRTVRCD